MDPTTKSQTRKGEDMTDSNNGERTFGGSIGKATGKAKEVAGEAIDNDDLAREGRLQHIKVDAAQDALRERREAERAEQNAELEREKAETREERERLEAQVELRRAEEAT